MPEQKDSFALATVQQLSPLYVAFEGQIDDNGNPLVTQVALVTLADYYPVVGDRVLLARVGKTWVVLGEIGPGWSPWTALGLGTHMSYVDTGEYRPAYRFHVGLQKVELRGLGRPTATLNTTETVFTVPAGISPAKIEILEHNAGAGAGSSGRLDVTPGGNINSRTALTTTNYVSLSGLSYSYSADI
jgi:hypothetical protein